MTTKTRVEITSNGEAPVPLGTLQTGDWFWWRADLYMLLDFVTAIRAVQIDTGVVSSFATEVLVRRVGSVEVMLLPQRST